MLLYKLLVKIKHIAKLLPCGPEPASLLCPRDFPGKNTGVDCHFLFQGIFSTQESPGKPYLAGYIDIYIHYISLALL